MNILSELTKILSNILPVETGSFSDEPPEAYAIITPMTEDFGFFADNTPRVDVQEVRISIYSKNNYIKLKNKILRKLIEADFTITDRKYIEYEEKTEYHHFVIDTANYYLKIYETE